MGGYPLRDDSTGDQTSTNALGLWVQKEISVSENRKKKESLIACGDNPKDLSGGQTSKLDHGAITLQKCNGLVAVMPQILIVNLANGYALEG